jgi:hypothetical protein
MVFLCLPCCQDQVYGPVVDGMVVSKSVLAPLVRATAINAGRMNREGFTPFYKQRAQYVHTNARIMTAS